MPTNDQIRQAIDEALENSIPDEPSKDVPSVLTLACKISGEPDWMQEKKLTAGQRLVCWQSPLAALVIINQVPGVLDVQTVADLFKALIDAGWSIRRAAQWMYGAFWTEVLARAMACNSTNDKEILKTLDDMRLPRIDIVKGLAAHWTGGRIVDAMTEIGWDRAECLRVVSKSTKTVSDTVLWLQDAGWSDSELLELYCKTGGLAGGAAQLHLAGWSDEKIQEAFRLTYEGHGERLIAMKSMAESRGKDLVCCSCLFVPDPDGGFSVHALNLPGVVSQGDTIEEATINIGRALHATIKTYRDLGLPIPWEEVDIDRREACFERKIAVDASKDFPEDPPEENDE